MIYKIYTTCLTGWVYKVEAETKKEAENKFWDGDYFDEKENIDWSGDSNEEIDEIVEN